MEKEELQKEYEDLIRFIQYSLKDLPKCILYGLDCADKNECDELLKDAQRLEKISEKLGIENLNYIEACRWHYKSYQLYLDEKKEYHSYEEYIKKHNGPESV